MHDTHIAAILVIALLLLIYVHELEEGTYVFGVFKRNILTAILASMIGGGAVTLLRAK